MNVTLELEPQNYSARALQFILVKADEWQVPPGEAIIRLLDMAAGKAGFKQPSAESPPNPPGVSPKPDRAA